MRYPDWFLKELRERVSIGDYAGKRLAWDRRKSRAGDLWAPCPFHVEKSASFHVRDREGVFKCFGCGAGGDIFTLCEKLEGLSFGEAVERLAGEAGLSLPDENPGARQAAGRRQRLLDAVKRADALFRAALRGPGGGAARAYLEGRGLSREVWDAFGIGLAPDGWTGLCDALQREGFKRDELVAAGLVKEGGRSGAIDVFRNRIMFPIADVQGRTIAFGGRALAKDEPAKYLNSPETELFHKGRTLYRLKEARAALARDKNAPLAIAEGYLDVIAFERAGIAAVAPLGTALTLDQLALAWKAHPAPALCLDGDGAGQRAAKRALEIALPELGPERTIRFARLPQGLDPDDIFRADGPGKLAEVLAGAVAAVDALFAFERDARALDVPEARADLKKRLSALAATIKDEETRRQYQRALNDRAFQLFAPPPRPERPAKSERGKGSQRRGPAPVEAVATPELKALAQSSRADAIEQMVRAPVDWPQILGKGADLFAAFPIEDPDLDCVRHAILDLWSSRRNLDRSTLSDHLQAAGKERALRRVSLWPAPAPLKRAGEGFGGRDAHAPSAGKAGTAPIGVDRSGGSEAHAEAVAEIEAEWMAFLTLDVTEPQVREEVTAARECDLDVDDDAFRAAEAALRARRTIAEAALRRALPSDPDAPDLAV